ncbi:MAG TPA: hypothetical protein VGG06_08480 [Thermoanaerobaculia bacterium]|jgi:hypothetical protein
MQAQPKRNSAVAASEDPEDPDDRFDHSSEKDEPFLARIEQSRRQAREGKYTRLEDLPD